jgi:D-serine deaminase-like pyridoxal phosphate-dependent protein
MSFPVSLDTPYLAVDQSILQRNLRAMAESTSRHGLALRPHAKTHKCVEIARRQLALGAVGLTVATVGEAEVFAAAGFDDLFIAYPVWASEGRAHRLNALAQQIRLRVGVESVEGARALGRAVGDASIEVLIEIDCGHHRTGISPEHAGEPHAGW